MSLLKKTLEFGKKITEKTQEAHALMKNIMFANVVTVIDVHKKAMSVNNNIMTVPSNNPSKHITVHFNSRSGVQDFLKFVREKRREMQSQETRLKKWFGFEDSNYLTMMDWLKLYAKTNNLNLPLHNEPYSAYASAKRIEQNYVHQPRIEDRYTTLSVL